MESTMLALVYEGEGRLALRKRPVPTIQESGDAIVRVTLSTICTSDLHIRNGAVPRARTGVTLGHEFVGEVVAVGAEVQTHKPGDRVAANCITFCGECWFCQRGFINNCQRGGWELGCRIDGCQAAYVRVPFADRGLTAIAPEVTDEQALFLGDILSSGYFGAQLADIRQGDTVAVIGAGPVGLCSMLCARLLGAEQIVAIDVDDSRLEVAHREGLAQVVLNPQRDNVEEQVKRCTQGRGADGVIEAAGGEDTFQSAWKIARPNASVALIAMYEQAQTLPLQEMYGKNLTFKTGGVDAVHCGELMELIRQGKLDTGFLITHRGTLGEILTGYDVFEHRRDGCLKWVVTPENV